MNDKLFDWGDMASVSPSEPLEESVRESFREFDELLKFFSNSEKFFEFESFLAFFSRFSKLSFSVYIKPISTQLFLEKSS